MLTTAGKALVYDLSLALKSTYIKWLGTVYLHWDLDDCLVPKNQRRKKRGSCKTQIQGRPFFVLKQPRSVTETVFKDDARYFFMCLFFLANEASHPVFIYVCHRSVTTLAINLSIVFSNWSRKSTVSWKITLRNLHSSHKSCDIWRHMITHEVIVDHCQWLLYLSFNSRGNSTHCIPVCMHRPFEMSTVVISAKHRNPSVKVRVQISV